MQALAMVSGISPAGTPPPAGRKDGYPMTRIIVPACVGIAMFLLFLGLTGCGDKRKEMIAEVDRGIALRKQGNDAEALKAFDKGVTLLPDNPYPRLERARLYIAQGRYDDAIGDYSVVIAALKGNASRKEQYYTIRSRRARVYQAKGDYAAAIAEFRAILKEEPTMTGLNNTVAWLLATSPDTAARNGRLAVEYATTACKIAGWKDPMLLDTLAAAYAESGNYPAAIKWQRQAIQLAGNSQHLTLYQKRLQLYQAGEPYRETPQSTSRQQ